MSDGFINREGIVVQITARLKELETAFQLLSFSIKNATCSTLDGEKRKLNGLEQNFIRSLFCASLDACLWNQKSVARRRTQGNNKEPSKGEKSSR